MDIEKLKQLTNERENMLWIDTTGVGMAAADYLEAAGVKVNRFTLLDQSELQQYLKSGKQENPEQQMPDEQIGGYRMTRKSIK